MKKSESIKLLATALTNAQKEFCVAVFDSSNPHFKNKFASLRSLREATKEQLSIHGLSISHTLGRDALGLHLETILAHTSGEWMSSETPLFLGKNDMQALGSAITYAKRYAKSAILDLVDGLEDDGNIAVGDAVTPSPQPRINRGDIETSICPKCGSEMIPGKNDKPYCKPCYIEYAESKKRS